MICISEEEYNKLQYHSKELAALKAGGVSNWEWYEESLEEFAKEYGYKSWDELEERCLERKEC